MATYFESAGEIRTPIYSKPRTSLKNKAITGLGAIATAIVHCLDTPYYLLLCIRHVIFLESTNSACARTTCKPRIEARLQSFSKRLWTVLAPLWFRPFHLPKKLWRKIFPPPCSHNRCELRRYVLPPSPWYHSFKHLYQPFQPRFVALQQHRNPFPFLNLPLELRNQIYLHASHANNTQTIRLASQWSLEKHTQYHCSHAAATTLVAAYDAFKQHANTRRSDRSEDTTFYQLDDNGVIAVHGVPPHMNLLLLNRQVYEEVKDAFWSTTAFEVQPLTPNDACWRLDQNLTPTYEALATSKYTRHMRKARVRIDVARFSMGRQCKRFERANAQVCTFKEIGLAECVRRLTPLAEELCGVLRASAPCLRVVEIYWIDGFAEEVGGDDLQMRASVLVPFMALAGVRVRIRKLPSSTKLGAMGITKLRER